MTTFTMSAAAGQSPVDRAEVLLVNRFTISAVFGLTCRWSDSGCFKAVNRVALSFAFKLSGGPGDFGRRSRVGLCGRSVGAVVGLVLDG